MAKYHINPVTGTPGLCHATSGSCPFGGPRKHYNTYEEAQTIADEIAMENWKEFGDKKIALPDELVDEMSRRDKLRIEYKDLENYSDQLVIDLLSNTDKGDLVRAVLNKDILFDRISNNRDITAAALRSPALPQDIIDDMVSHPQNYSEFSVLELGKNDKITPDQCARLPRGHGYFVARDIVARNPKFTEEDVRRIVTDLKTNGTENYPGISIYVITNKACPQEVYDSAFENNFFGEMIKLIN